MMHSKQQNPLTVQQAEGWLGRFSEAELSRHGWSKLRVRECFEKYEYIYGLQENAPISLIFYHFPDFDTLEIIFLATNPGAERQSRMYGLFQGLMATHPKRKIWLECREDNLPAIALYKKLGLRETGRRPAYYNDGSAAISFNF